MPDIQIITRLTFTDGKKAAVKIHYYENCEQSLMEIPIADFSTGQAEFFQTTGSDETFEVSGGLTIIRLNVDNLARATNWYIANCEC